MQLMLFFKAPFMVPHFSHYTLMVLLMFPVILLPTQIILLSILSVFGFLICGKSHSQLLILNLTFETLSVGQGRKWIVDFSAGKAQLISIDQPSNMILLMLNWMCQSQMKNHPLKSWDCLSLLNWIGTFALSLLLKHPKKPGANLTLKFHWPLVSCYLCKSMSWPCMEYCCHV